MVESLGRHPADGGRNGPDRKTHPLDRRVSSRGFVHPEEGGGDRSSSGADPVSAARSGARPGSCPSPARLEVVQLQLTANREFVGARIRLSGEELSGVDPAEIYMVDEATGEKFPVMRLQRIGKLAEFNVPGEDGTRYVMFRNREGMLKAGKRVTIVVGKTRQEHLLIRR